ncbi:hypothetical protein Ddye_015478 [Dipteronia dyeriana]|uniref:Ubiquitin carboxyl-terminal hydrolase n=1 Tax=Dipteronia dyeriana TaxID=168575 RepID=A0AAD9U5Z3_9ROSI|nr:hypothetical protein Ddye_015478 [Dipteronia dyeriana]
MLTVSVKWKKEVFPNVEIDTSQPPYVFKCQLYDLTGVPPERQKIMVKGGLLKDDSDWSTLGVKKGQKLMMMGTADEIVKAPEKGPVFVEDLPEEEQVLAPGHSAGLFNLGNTCYINSTVQCLHSVPELKSALVKYSQSGRSNDVDQSSHMLAVATSDLFNDLDKSVKPVAPRQFWMDAEECWTQLLFTLSQSLRTSNASENADTVKAPFGIDIVSRTHCQETGEESSEAESVYSLKCHISQEGLKSELEKASPALCRSAIYLKDSHLNGLPRYLTIQFVRFFLEERLKSKSQDFAGVTSDPDKDTHLTGVYDLVAVLTHMGRSADSGHYVAWVKQASGKWIEYDDNNPIPQWEEDISKLSGGGSSSSSDEEEKEILVDHDAMDAEEEEMPNMDNSNRP